MDFLTIAMAKGRLQKDASSLLKEMGIANIDAGRRLFIDFPDSGLRLLYAKNADVITLVRNGVASLGLVGKDMLLEHGADGTYELCDLNLSVCRLSLAAPLGMDKNKLFNLPALRIATKYPHVAASYLSEHDIKARLIHLYGSVELAPAIGLADGIIDLVDTGNTLKAHDLYECDLILRSSARLICSESAFKVKRERILKFKEKFTQGLPAIQESLGI